MNIQEFRSRRAYERDRCLFVFEAVPMLIALGVLGWWHPNKQLHQKTVSNVAELKEQAKAKERLSGLEQESIA